jgi:type II secretory pathway component PulC
MRTLLPGCLALGLLACGAESPPPASPPAPASASASPSASSALPASGPGLPRAAVDAAVKQGPPIILERVEVEAELTGRKFHGWRITRFVDAKFFQGVDLAPGDVVTAVNGFPIEHPEQLQTAFDSLSVASELRVDYERNGEKRALVYPIVDDNNTGNSSNKNNNNNNSNK